MADAYPELRTDREVVLVHDGRSEQARLRCWLDGPDRTYRVELAIRAGRHRGPYTATGPDVFEALVRLRRQLEPEGLAVAVQGARRDTFPSGMGRDMGGGQRIYVMRPGHQALSDDLVETLADAPVDQLATVDEQRAFRDEWQRQLRSRVVDGGGGRV